MEKCFVPAKDMDSWRCLPPLPGKLWLSFLIRLVTGLRFVPPPSSSRGKFAVTYDFGSRPPRRFQEPRLWASLCGSFSCLEDWVAARTPSLEREVSGHLVRTARFCAFAKTGLACPFALCQAGFGLCGVTAALGFLVASAHIRLREGSCEWVLRGTGTYMRVT